MAGVADVRRIGVQSGAGLINLAMLVSGVALAVFLTFPRTSPVLLLIVAVVAEIAVVIVAVAVVPAEIVAVVQDKVVTVVVVALVANTSR